MFFNYMSFFCFIFHLRIVMSFSLSKESAVENKENGDLTSLKDNMLLTGLEEMSASNNDTKIRAKRESSGAGKFTDAAKMPQVKMMRLFMQLFKNFWDSAYVGGAHPFHRDVPKTIVTLYKQKIVEFFVPDVGEDPEKLMN